MLRCFYTELRLPIGDFILLEINGALCGLCSPEQLPDFQKKLQKHTTQPIDFTEEFTALLQEGKKQLEEYFSGLRQEFSLPTQLYGTEFQKSVWNQLTLISYGTSRSYGEIAAALGTKGAQAVGNAVGANPLPIIIPCHRVLPSDGSLGNFSMKGGPSVKAFLLDLEEVSYH